MITNTSTQEVSYVASSAPNSTQAIADKSVSNNTTNTDVSVQSEASKPVEVDGNTQATASQVDTDLLTDTDTTLQTAYQLMDTLFTMKEKAVSAMDAGASEVDRASFNNEFTALKEQANSLITNLQETTAENGTVPAFDLSLGGDIMTISTDSDILNQTNARSIADKSFESMANLNFVIADLESGQSGAEIDLGNGNTTELIDEQDNVVHHDGQTTFTPSESEETTIGTDDKASRRSASSITRQSDNSLEALARFNAKKDEIESGVQQNVETDISSQQASIKTDQLKALLSNGGFSIANNNTGSVLSLFSTAA